MTFKQKLITTIVAVSIGFLGATAWKIVNVANGPISIYPTTFANNQRDTVIFRRSGTLAGLAFAIHSKDSMSISEIYVRRLVGGEFSTDSTRLVGAVSNVAAGYQGTTANPSYAAIYSVAVATQYCDAFAVVVVYAGSGNGVTNNKMDYFFETQNYEE